MDTSGPSTQETSTVDPPLYENAARSIDVLSSQSLMLEGYSKRAPELVKDMAVQIIAEANLYVPKSVVCTEEQRSSLVAKLKSIQDRATLYFEAASRLLIQPSSFQNTDVQSHTDAFKLRESFNGASRNS